MLILKKIFIAALFYFIFVKAYCQTEVDLPTPIFITSVKLDTIESKINSNLIHVQWLNDTINVDIQNEHLKMDTTVVQALRNSFKDSTVLTRQEDIDEFLLAKRTYAQNCYSYALERYFGENETFNQDIFSKSSHLDRESSEKILNNYFYKVAEISTSPKKNLSQPIPNDVLLAFINKSGWAIHFVYYRNEVFYSKNGSFKPIEFQSLKKFLKKHFWDTEKIIAYKIDEDKVKSFYANR
ncbi:MAG: hypothetical protein CMO01_10440 [Thalassobius sp.]|nr:hypothetical protein [Thalassovita sp.]